MGLDMLKKIIQFNAKSKSQPHQGTVEDQNNSAKSLNIENSLITALVYISRGKFKNMNFCLIDSCSKQ